MTMVTGGFTSISGTPDLDVDQLLMDSFEEEPLYYTGYFEIDDTTKEQVKIIKMSGFGAMPQLEEGKDIAMDAAVEEWDMTADVVDYALGFKLSKKMRRAIAQYHELITKWAKALGRSAAETLRVTHVNILNRAFNSSYTWGDGLELCSDAHPTAGSTASNEPASAADLSYTSLNAAVVAMGLQVDYRGLHAAVVPSLLVTSTTDGMTAKQILGSEVQSSALQKNTFQNTLRHTEDPGIDNVDNWFVIDERRNPLQSRTRQALDQRSYVEESSEGLVHKASMAFVVYCEDWPGIYGTIGA